MKYVKPDKNAKSFTCPHCNTLSTQEFSTLYFDYERGLTADHNSKYYFINAAKCLNCNKKTIWIDDEYIYPEILPIEPSLDMPESVLKLYNEAGLIYNKSPRAACALLRLAIDQLCRELGKTDRDINKNIADLVKDGLPTKIQQGLDIVRVVGNKAVHPGQIDFDVDDIETVNTMFWLINKIVESLISDVRELNELYGKLPENVKSAIEKRDK